MTAPDLSEKLNQLQSSDAFSLLRDSLFGLEKESLRMDAQGNIAQTPHPMILGSALTHPYITTDYSENLLEYVTPPFTSYYELNGFLQSLRAYVDQHIGEEWMWAASMPPPIANESDIPIANYGSSNVGRMKEIYRIGLGHRYGRRMQVIAGIHFNYSFGQGFFERLYEIEGAQGDLQSFISDRYFALIRNVKRYAWLLLYLFGASPAVCKDFLAGNDRDLESISADTLLGRYSTSLRMSDIGYQNSVQDNLSISINSLDEYLSDMRRAVTTEYPPYQKIGIEKNGEFRQLSASYLQVENEYYSTIRPKRPIMMSETPSHALQRGGVEYIELRTLDVNPFSPVGVDQETLAFTELFLLFCLLADSEPLCRQGLDRSRKNVQATARRGRDPNLKILCGEKEAALAEHAAKILDVLEQLAEKMSSSVVYNRAVSDARAKISDSSLTPSAQVEEAIRDHENSYVEFVTAQSKKFKRDMVEQSPIDQAFIKELLEQSALSTQEQRQIEQSQTDDLACYLRSYFSSYFT